MEAVDMERRLLVIVFVLICLCVNRTWSVRENENVVSFQSYAVSAEDAVNSISSRVSLERSKRDVSDDQAKCSKQEQDFLSSLKTNTHLANKFTFANKTHFNLAMAWASDHDKGTLIVVTTDIILMTFAVSNIWRSTDYGRTWTNIDDLVNKAVIRQDQGLQRNPHEASWVYMLTHKETVHITEDGGQSFTARKVPKEGAAVASLIFHTDNRPNFILAIATNGDLFATNNNFKDNRLITEKVWQAEWGNEEMKEPDAIFAMVGTGIRHAFMSNKVITFTLTKFADVDASSNEVLYKNVIGFGIQGAFIYASVYMDANPTQTSKKAMMVSTNGGKTWNEAQLPTLDGDRFYSVLDMSEHLIFMHVDNPGDTGSGTLYTSAQAGVVYSESLLHHLYPNFNSVTDFYKVESMRGVYLASQINEDKSIHTMITYNRGANWQPIIPPQGDCKDHSKACQLQIHNIFSISKGVRAKPPISTANAPGLVLVHAHAADALQTTLPNIYITTDGGYNWRKTLDGPHYYQITDSGGLLVAVSTKQSMPKHIKFSTDEGNCWHDYKYTDEDIVFTGLLTEPGGRSMTVSIWGYSNDQQRQWVVYVINFADVITKKCTDTDYEIWKPHSEMRRHEKEGVEGCLLGLKQSFKKLKADSWCQNGYEHDVEKTEMSCRCTREDYECDYSFYRPPSTDDCVREPGFTGKEVDVCLRGHEEVIITEGYRKIPGDVCTGGVTFIGKKINMTAMCSVGSKMLVMEMEAPVQKADHSVVFGAIITVVVILIAAVSGYFLYKMYLLQKHKVVYRYSMLNQTEGDDYANELENALTQQTLYEDSDDEALPHGSAMQKGSANRTTTRTKSKVKSFHDDSDDDMLE
ncbi:sortilin-like isoform X1 [Haliotis cracherodii]|uniref:sortilin-like isoform X1 n=2 Tax=Haliotis cracherodii TaxID=6455 RepID=UPI0039EBA258